jgi:hypothetical protein
VTEQIPAVVALVVDENGKWTLRVADPEDRLIVVIVEDHRPEPYRKTLHVKREGLEGLVHYIGPMKQAPQPQTRPKLTLHQGGRQ